MDTEYASMEEEKAEQQRPEPTSEEKFFYWFDNFFATNPMAKVYMLCVVNLVFMVFFAVCFHITGSQGGDWSENFWMGFTFAADMAEDDHGGPFPYAMTWVFRVMNFSFSFGGAFVFGLVINFLSSWIDDRVGGLRKGKTKVMENGHTLILGWNDRTVSVLNQICQANESELEPRYFAMAQNDPTSVPANVGLPIVILADRDKEEMDDELMDSFPPEERRGCKIVTRQGNPIEPKKLLKVAVAYARSIIVLSEGEDPDEADAQSVRCILALTGQLASQGWRIKCHITCELQDIDNADVAMLGVTEGVPEDVVVPVISHDVIGKLMIQCSREIGLSKAFEALLCFEGSECYFSAWNSGEGHYEDGITGKRFADCCYCFRDAAVIGVRFANPESDEVLAINPEGRPFLLNPSGDYYMQYNDKLLVIAEDDHRSGAYAYGPSNNPNTTPIPPFELPPKEPERFMLAGWRRDMDDIVRELDKWVPPGSHLTMFNRFSCEKQIVRLKNGDPAFESLNSTGASASNNLFQMAGVLTNIATLELIQGDCTSGKQLERLGPAKFPDDFPDRVEGSRYRVEEFDTILTLSIDATVGNMDPDSRVMVSMLVMRYISEKRGVMGKTLVAEIRSPTTQELMDYTKCSDSVVGNRLIAMILAQISEDRDLGYVMEDLFSEEGMEMHVKDIRLFVGPDELLSWWELLDRCQQRNFLPVGWIRKNGNPEVSEWEAVLNPGPWNGYDKDQKMRWTGMDGILGDLLIVISED